MGPGEPLSRAVEPRGQRWDAPEPAAANSSEGEETGARPLNPSPRDAKGSALDPTARLKVSHAGGPTGGTSGGPVPWAEAIAQVPAPVPANPRHERVGSCPDTLRVKGRLSLAEEVGEPAGVGGEEAGRQTQVPSFNHNVN